MERSALGEAFTGALHPNVGILDSRAEFLDQSRLSNSRLARHENVLPGAVAGPEPTRPQHIEHALTVDKRGWPADADAPPAPTDAARRDGPVKLDWARDARERMCATILNDELTRDKIVHGTGHQNGIGGAPCLNARRDVGRIAEDLDFVGAQLVNDHPSTMDSHTNRELRICFSCKPPV